MAQAVQAEFEEFLLRFAADRFEDGRAAVVRNGFQPEREVLTGLWPVSVRIPKARSRAAAPAVFHGDGALGLWAAVREIGERSPGRQYGVLVWPRVQLTYGFKAPSTNRPLCRTPPYHLAPVSCVVGRPAVGKATDMAKKPPQCVRGRTLSPLHQYSVSIQVMNAKELIRNP